MTTAYDRVAYPTIVHQAVHPERMAVAARLAGLDPVPVDQARVLDIGGGTCLSLTAFAAQYPGSVAHGFDLAESAIARGVELAGPECHNVELVVEDITRARERYAAKSFDYVIAHGVYAWVPEPVRVAVLELIGHVLSDRGVAFVSFNAMPGGHIRLLLRDMLLYEVQGITDPDERVETAYALLRAFAERKDEGGDKADPTLAGLRWHADHMSKRPPSVLFHDELGECFAPQSLSQVVHDAAPHGLRWLTDAGRNRNFDGFLADGQDGGSDPDATVLRAAQSRDYLEIAFFRAPLFVRSEAPIDRKIDPERLDGLWISTNVRRLESGEFRSGDDVFAVGEEGLAERIAELAAAWPERRPVSEIALDEAQRLVVLRMYQEWYATLHPGPAPFAVTPGERPQAGPWIRGMLAREEEYIVTLASQTIRIDQPELRRLLIAADGTRTIDELIACDHGLAAEHVPGALAAAARRALLVG